MLKKGDQIIYIPSHAEGDKNHKDVEYGFVTGVNPKFVFCRYWSKVNRDELRTKSCSEGTPEGCLVLYMSKPQGLIWQLLEKIKNGENL